MSDFERDQKIVVTREQAVQSKHNELVDIMDRAMPPVDRLDGYVKKVEGDTVWLAFPRIDQQGQYSFSRKKLEGTLSKAQADQSNMEKK